MRTVSPQHHPLRRELFAHCLNSAEHLRTNAMAGGCLSRSTQQSDDASDRPVARLAGELFPGLGKSGGSQRLPQRTSAQELNYRLGECLRIRRGP